MNIFRCNKKNKYNYNNFSCDCPKNCYKQCNNCINKSCSCFNFCEKKENTLCSLREVECFLCNCQKAIKAFKFYCFFK